MESIIKLTDIGREYKIGEETIYALKSITLEIFKNEYVALMGPSGRREIDLNERFGLFRHPN